MNREVVTPGTVLGLVTAALFILAAVAVATVMLRQGAAPQPALLFRHGLLVAAQFDPRLADCPVFLLGED